MIKHLKSIKVMVMSLMTLTVFVTTIGFSNTKASAELYRGTFGVVLPFEHECTLIVDKANNIVKTNKLQKSTGVCKVEMEGYYYHKGKKEFATTYGWVNDNINYNGEPYFDTDVYTGYKKPHADNVILYAFVTNSKENIKGKVMHVAAANLNVYKSANTKSKKITSVKRYKTVKVKGTNGSWARVIANGKTGWVARKYLVNEVTVAEIEKVVTKYKVENWKSEQVPVGKTVRDIKGKNGLKYVYYKTKYKNGKLVAKKRKIWTDVIQYTQNEVNRVGVESDLNH